MWRRLVCVSVCLGVWFYGVSVLAVGPDEATGRSVARLTPPDVLRYSNDDQGGDPDTDSPHSSAWEKRIYAGVFYDYPTETSEVSTTVNTGSSSGVSVGNRRLELKSTVGAFGEFDFPMSRNLVFGLRGEFKRWEKDFSSKHKQLRSGDTEGNFLFNFNAVFKARHPFPTTPAAIYVGLPVGLSFVFPPSRNNDLAGAPEFETGLTWNASLVGGFRFLVSDSVGLFTEFGLKYQRVRAPTKKNEDVYEFSYTTVGLNGGVVF